MPAYSSSPFAPPVKVLIPGQISYSLGSYDRRAPNTRMLVTSVAITSNVATLGVSMVEGNIPAVGALLSVQGTQKATSGGGSNFNITNVALASVSINATTGVGTITFALTSSNITTTADAGQAIVLTPELGEAIATGTTGIPFTMFPMGGLASNSRDVSWEVETPSAPSSFTAVLQGSDSNVDADFVTIDTTTATGARTLTGVRFQFIRGKYTAVSGGSNPTGVLKILV